MPEIELSPSRRKRKLSPGDVGIHQLRTWLRWPAGGRDEAKEEMRLCSGHQPCGRGAGLGLESEPSDPDPIGGPGPWMVSISPGSPGPKKTQPFHRPRLQLGSSKPGARTPRPRQPNPEEALAPQLHWTRGAWLRTQLSTPRTSEPFFPGLFNPRDGVKGTCLPRAEKQVHWEVDLEKAGADTRYASPSSSPCLPPTSPAHKAHPRLAVEAPSARP